MKRQQVALSPLICEVAYNPKTVLQSRMRHLDFKKKQAVEPSFKGGPHAQDELTYSVRVSSIAGGTLDHAYIPR